MASLQKPVFHSLFDSLFDPSELTLFPAVLV